MKFLSWIWKSNGVQETMSAVYYSRKFPKYLKLEVQISIRRGFWEISATAPLEEGSGKEEMETTDEKNLKQEIADLDINEKSETGKPREPRVIDQIGER